MEKMKKLALVDIDRTLVEGSIGVFITNTLSKTNIFPRKNQKAIEKTILLNKKGKLSYKKRGKIIIKNWAEGFKGHSQREILLQSKKIFNKNRDLISI